jgi:hypothetical protein
MTSRFYDSLINEIIIPYTRIARKVGQISLAISVKKAFGSWMPHLQLDYMYHFYFESGPF